jgi:hypothetical protein
MLSPIFSSQPSPRNRSVRLDEVFLAPGQQGANVAAPPEKDPPGRQAGMMNAILEFVGEPDHADHGVVPYPARRVGDGARAIATGLEVPPRSQADPRACCMARAGVRGTPCWRQPRVAGRCWRWSSWGSDGFAGKAVSRRPTIGTRPNPSRPKSAMCAARWCGSPPPLRMDSAAGTRRIRARRK